MNLRTAGFWPFLILLILAFIWGSSFILMKIGLEELDPMEVASFRVAVAGLVLTPISLRALWRFRGKWKPMLAVGMLGNLIPAFLFAKAQTVISSSLSGMLNSLTAVFTLLFGVWFFKVVAEKKKWWGVFIALGGSSLLFLDDLLSTDLGQIQYGALVLLATACYGMSVNTIRTYLSGIKSVEVAALSLLPVSLISLVVYLNVGDLSTFSHEAGRISLGAIFLLAVTGTAFASVLFFHLVARTSALFASTVTYLIPLVAIFWGVLDGEKIHWMEGLGMLTILLGILLTRK